MKILAAMMVMLVLKINVILAQDASIPKFAAMITILVLKIGALLD